MVVSGRERIANASWGLLSPVRLSLALRYRSLIIDGRLTHTRPICKFDVCERSLQHNRMITEVLMVSFIQEHQERTSDPPQSQLPAASEVLRSCTVLTLSMRKF